MGDPQFVLFKTEQLSFQSAIIVPRINLIGYDTATAKSSRLNDSDVVNHTSLLIPDGTYPCERQCGFSKEMNIPTPW